MFKAHIFSCGGERGDCFILLNMNWAQWSSEEKRTRFIFRCYRERERWQIFLEREWVYANFQNGLKENLTFFLPWNLKKRKSNFFFHKAEVRGERSYFHGSILMMMIHGKFMGWREWLFFTIFYLAPLVFCFFSNGMLCRLWFSRSCLYFLYLVPNVEK